MTTITIPQDYAYVLAVATSTGFLLLGQQFTAGALRKAAGIPYPFQYPTKEQYDTSLAHKKFFCGQRAHGNTLEALPFFLFGLLFSGFEFPRTAAGLGAVWVAGRVLYTLGYVTGDPKKRMRGAMHNAGWFGLLVTSTLSVVNLLRA